MQVETSTNPAYKNNPIWIYLLWALVICTTNTGCSKPSQPANEDPKVTLSKLQRTLADNDSQGFVSNFTGPHGHKDAAAALFEYNMAVRKFNLDLQKKFGKNAVEQFANTQSDPTISLDAIPDDPSWIDRLKFEKGADEITISEPHAATELLMKNIDGHWKIVLGSETMPPKDLQSIFSKMTNLLLTATPLIDEADSLQSLKSQLARDFLKKFLAK